MNNFAITGVAGYIAPRHLKAIKGTNNNLVAALDLSDSVGIIDSYFPEADFFTEFERFDRHIDKLRRENKGKEVNYISICSPNYLHDAHIRFSLRVGANAICEKPIVLNPWNIDALLELEKEYSKKVYTILQLRLHPVMIKLKNDLINKRSNKKHQVILTYITSRGHWYLRSWKGNLEKSGGLATNIGIHFFDILIWLFGNVEKSEVHLNTATSASGYLELENASVNWFLSIDSKNLPDEAVINEKRTYRLLSIDENKVEFSEGFTDLHTAVYRDILAGGGFGLIDAKPSIQLAYEIRKAKIQAANSMTHPLANKLID